MSELVVQERGAGVRFSVRVQPRAGRGMIAGVHGGALKVRLASAPVDGAANAELIALLAARLEVPKRDVRIVNGETGRTKVIEVHGVDAQRVRELAAE
jgi:uncharacterized protein (TIGR00251 family)